MIPYKYTYRAFSECGPRYQNEDTIGVVELPQLHDSLFILCDGMGGHRYGDVASQTIVKSFDNFWRSNSKRGLCKKKLLDASEEAMVALNKRQFLGMGTTMALIAINNNHILTAHCGDSRIYYSFKWKDKVISGHLRDHIAETPEGWSYVAKSFIQRENKHIPEIHDFNMELEAGSKFLISSDGVYNAFDEGEIENILSVTYDIDHLENILYERCVSKARDNYSAIIISIL